MIDQLKKIYPSLVVHQSLMNHVDPKYEWYVNNDQKLIGIHKSELTPKDMELLSTFLITYSNTFPIPTPRERFWEQRISEIEDTALDSSRFRFVYFSIPTNQIEPKLFKEALTALFDEQISIIWVNQQEGIIVEEQEPLLEADNQISYEQIIDVLMSDLYVKINFMVGPYQDDLQQVSKHYQKIIETARIAFSYTDKHVISYIQAIPYVLVDQIDPVFKKELTDTMLKEFSEDHELLQTIEAFLDSNLNISVAAKKLYMHRNSLQYRLDKFQESTGIDVREFHQALTVYLALVANK